MYEVIIRKLVGGSGKDGITECEVWEGIFTQKVEDLDIKRVAAVVNNIPFVLSSEEVERIAKKKMEIERR